MFYVIVEAGALVSRCKCMRECYTSRLRVWRHEMDLELEGDEIGASDKRTRGREDRLAMSKKCYMSILALDVQVMIALIPSMPYELAIASSLACSCVLKLISMSNQAVLVHGC